MSANDDDLGDDDQLKQLRSVWVSMRESDEDPPNRGLDALMAAARTKAADMTPASGEGFWSKVLAVFRRPPVLALASITVVLGGALFIAQRRDKLQTQETASDRQEQRVVAGAGSGAAVAPPSPPSLARPAETVGSGSAAPVPPATVARPVEAPRPQPRARPQERPEPATPPELDGSKSGAKKPVKADDAGEDVRIASPTVTQTEAVDGPAQAQPDSVKVAPQGATRGPTVKAPAAAPSDPLSGADTKRGLGGEEAGASADRGAKESQVTQLVKQCESAAARNDCAAVRFLAKKIKDTDAGAYRQRIANNTSIARCLE